MKMNIKTIVTNFVIVFALILVVSAIVTFLWNLIRYGETAVEWETAFRFAIIFGIILTWIKAREKKENKKGNN